ncbi:Fe-S cluster assembly sulfur transfer protein SufU [Butyrivibrio sp. NC2002]|uniref:Fe-S cluster assembly sulfur transfer protein SufU n=1 Tax=Butyrivibrio sp. NC2002 TaxID=1410610 RepID=UPI00056C2829|nr:SUF system NifU family Fe-S cluster assembly protein [Butyrivibrio sp. NC2002]
MDLKGLYREIVNEHNLRPSHKGQMENPDLVLRGVNPSCGDDITLQLKIENGVIEDALFNGSGCAISQASVDMMADQVIGRSKEDAIKLAGTFMGMIKGDIKDEAQIEELDEAASLQDIAHMPARVKCAVLGWKTMQEMLEHPEKAENISTENA